MFEVDSPHRLYPAAAKRRGFSVSVEIPCLPHRSTGSFHSPRRSKNSLRTKILAIIVLYKVLNVQPLWAYKIARILREDVGSVERICRRLRTARLISPYLGEYLDRSGNITIVETEIRSEAGNIPYTLTTKGLEVLLTTVIDGARCEFALDTAREALTWLSLWPYEYSYELQRLAESLVRQG